MIPTDLRYMRERHQARASDSRVSEALSERILDAITAENLTPVQVKARIGTHFDRKDLWRLRERTLHDIWSQERLLKLACGLGIRCGYFVEDEAFPAVTPTAKKAA